MNHQYLVELLTKKDGIPLPGTAFQQQFAPPGRDIRFDPKRYDRAPRKSAVLLLIYPFADNDCRLLLTRRQDFLKHHAGQISFPGGSFHSHEVDPWQVALREAEEEVALAPHLPRPIKELTPLFVPPSHFLIHPVLGAMDHFPEGLSPQPSEVAALLHVPLHALISQYPPRPHKVEIQPGSYIQTPAFIWDEKIIWGATALIICELLEWFNRKQTY